MTILELSKDIISQQIVTSKKHIYLKILNTNIIFCNLQNSGSSAVDPILKEILTKLNYHIAYGPDQTEKLRCDIKSGKITRPFYHWTHTDLPFFNFLKNNKYTKFIYLHRDPRDAAISFANYLMSTHPHFKNIKM
mgnify:FL=1